jgi:tetratricopeptide (TPR) repeat protein
VAGRGGEALYEHYKDALKRGHVASLRGNLDEALDAYAAASRIAPERPAPHTSAGTALLRRRRPAEALRYYDMALRLAPRDETALLGRAQALVALGRRPDAADAFDTLAEVRLAGGQLADAVDAARRALELAEGRERRRTLQRLLGRLRASEPDEPGRLALERALLVLEGPAVGGPHPAGTEPGAVQEREAPGVSGGGTVAGGDGADASAAEAAAASAQVAGERAPEPARRVLERDLPAGIGLDELTRRGEAALDAGAASEAVERLLDLAAASRDAGYPDAALDACYTALSLAPGHVDLHLAFAELYDEQGWPSLAAEKLDLLDRLAALGDDEAAVARVAAARAVRR